MNSLPRCFGVPSLLLALLAGCTGGSGATDSTASTAGNVSITIADPNPDTTASGLSSFAVDVSDIQLIRMDGSAVSVLAHATRVDFANLATLAELVVASGIPAATYAGLTMTFDFTHAQVVIAGQSVPASVVDGSGNPIVGPQDVRVDFGNSTRPHVAVSRRTLLELQIDLSAAVTIDTANNRVTFDPILFASPDPAEAPPAAIHGTLGAVTTSSHSFVVDRHAEDHHATAHVTVDSSNSTVYQVDGVVYHGDNGLTALAALAPGAAVFVRGERDPTADAIDADEVEAGAGVPGNGQDQVSGMIIGRDTGAGNDAVLQVLGTAFTSDESEHDFATLFTVHVQLGPTHVLRAGAGNSLTTDALDVGQHVDAFGRLTGTSLDATGAVSPPGVVRMQPTRVVGAAVAAAASNVLSVNVARFDSTPASRFDFTVANVAEANPTAYKLDVTGLDTTGIAATTPLAAIGFVNAVGIANDPDFTALSLEGRGTVDAMLKAVWPASAANPAITTLGATGVTLDVGDASVATVFDGMQQTLLTATPAPRIVPAASGGAFMFGQGRHLQVFTDFGEFSAALQAVITSGKVVRRITAAGTFTDIDQTLTARRVAVMLR